MGNLCGRESDPFSQPGRRLGAAPAAPTSASVPASATSRKPTIVSESRTLGGSGQASSSGGGGGGGGSDEARRNAAAAAEARFQKSRGGGKLQADLNAKRSQSNSQLIQEEGRKKAGYQTMDQNNEVLAYD